MNRRRRLAIKRARSLISCARNVLPSSQATTKQPLKKSSLNPMTNVLPLSRQLLTGDIVTTSSRDGSVYIWDLRCTGVQSQSGAPRYKPTASIFGGHPYARKRKPTELAKGAAITGLTWANDAIITACDANSYPLPPD
jgi:hypothetical protein